jgi:hypothetical protein
MSDFGSDGWGFESLRSHKIKNMELIALIVLIGLGYWIIKIPYEIIKFIVGISWILLITFVYYIINKKESYE